MTAQRLEKASRVTGSMSGLASPSGMSAQRASEGADEARAIAAAAGSVRRAPAAPMVTGAPPPPAMRAGLGGYQPPEETFTEAYANSVQSIRSNVASRVSRRAQNWAGKENLSQDPRNPNVWYRVNPDDVYYDPTSQRWKDVKTGSFMDQSYMDSLRVVKTPGFKQTANGRWINEATKKFASADEVRAATTGWDEVADFQRKARVSGAVAETMNKWSSGEPIGRALLNSLPGKGGAAVGKAAGIAGAVYQGIRKAASTSQAMYAQGRDIAQYTGGSATEGFMEAMKDRVGAWAQGFNFFGPGAEDYMAFASAANRSGMRGNQKQAYIRQGLDIMKNVNAGSEETNRIMQTFFQARQSLDGLSDSLRDVTDSARLAGIAGTVAREMFEQNFKTFTSGIAAGTGSARGQAIAIGTTEAQMAGGRGNQFSETSTNQSRRYVATLAAQSGMTISEYTSQVASGSRLLEVDRDNLVIQQFASIGFTKDLVMQVQQEYPTRFGQTYPFGSTPSVGHKNNLALMYSERGIDYFLLLDIMSNAGYTNIPNPESQEGVVPGDVYDFAQNIVMGLGVGGRQAAEAFRQSQNSEAKTVETSTRRQEPISGRAAAGRQYSTSYQANLAYSDYLGLTTGTGASRTAFGAEGTFTTMPEVEAFIASLDPNIEKNSSETFSVVGSNGERVTVGWKELISKYANQIASGEASYVTSSDETLVGRVVADTLSTSSAPPGVGASSSTTNVVVKPTAELERFLVFVDSQNAGGSSPVPTSGP